MTPVVPRLQLKGRRLTLRPVLLSDFNEWSEVRVRNGEWLTQWEPKRPGAANPDTDKDAFALRCTARDREWQFGTGYGFGIFVGNRFVGEINLNSVQRGPFQGGSAGYWIDEAYAGRGLTPEGLVVLFAFAFDDLGLERVEVAIVPRNKPSIRVVEKLSLRHEGLAADFLEIAGVREDHLRYAMTKAEWVKRRPELNQAFIV